MDDSDLNAVFSSKLNRNMFHFPSLAQFDTSFNQYGTDPLPFHLSSSNSPESTSYEAHSASAETTSDESIDLPSSNGNTSPKSWSIERRRRAGPRAKELLPQERILKRRVQNRAAQRSFRERQKEYVMELEHEVQLLKEQILMLHENYQGILTAVTAPHTANQMANLDMSPPPPNSNSSRQRDFELSRSVGDLSSISGGAVMFPQDLGNGYRGLLYS